MPQLVGSLPPASDGERRLSWLFVGAATSVGLIVRFALPSNILHESSHGFSLLDMAVLPGLTYDLGAAQCLFYKPWAWIFGPNPNPEIVFSVNRIVGAGNLAGMYFLCAVAYRCRAAGVLGLLLTFFFLPQIRLSASEEAFAVITAGLIWGLAFTAAGVQQQSGRLLVVGAALVMAGSTFRAETATHILACAALLAILFVNRKLPAGGKYRSILAATVLFALPHVLFVASLRFTTNRGGSVFHPSSFTESIVAILGTFGTFLSPDNLFLNPTVTPIAYPLLLFIGARALAVARTRAFLSGLPFVVVIIVVQFAVAHTLPFALRVPAPAHLLLIAVASASVAFPVWPWQGASAEMRGKLATVLVLASLVLGLIAPPPLRWNVDMLWKEDNMSRELDFLKETLPTLAPTAIILLLPTEGADPKPAAGFSWALLRFARPGVEALEVTSGTEALRVARDAAMAKRLLIYQGVVSYGFLENELQALGIMPPGQFNRRHVFSFNNTADSLVRPEWQLLRQELRLVPVAEVAFDNVPHDHIIIPQRRLTIGFYRLSEN